jgi:3-oxoacyl-[acyl-carrier-protein] synthase-1
VLAGGVDSLCLTSLHGFESLQLVSRQPARPCDADRNGLSIGEGAAFVLIERDGDGVRVHGGETSDGVNMSTPPADGSGAAEAMRIAMTRAGIGPGDIGYVNLHGTATPTNDTAECIAVSTVFGNDVPVSSLKGSIGHTLGAAGAVETVLSLIALQEGIAPGNVGLTERDAAIACNIVPETLPMARRHVMSNAFGFGGNNCALVLSL